MAEATNCPHRADDLQEDGRQTGPAHSDHMRECKWRGREMFAPLAHPQGHAQADFGEAVVTLGDSQRKSHCFIMDLPHGDACHVQAHPAAAARHWVDGHVHACGFFGKMPTQVLYDKDRCRLAKILPDGTRQRVSLFIGILSHCPFCDRYGRPCKGNSKGNAEGLVSLARRNFMVPLRCSRMSDRCLTAPFPAAVRRRGRSRRSEGVEAGDDRDADTDLGGLTVGGEPLERSWFDNIGERHDAVTEGLAPSR